MREPFEGVLKTIGNTPLVEIRKLNPNKNVKIFAKLESFNPGGSVKDRPALYMIETGRGAGRAHARQDHPRGDERQHGHRPRHGGCRQGLPPVPHPDRVGQRGAQEDPQGPGSGTSLHARSPRHRRRHRGSLRASCGRSPTSTSSSTSSTTRTTRRPLPRHGRRDLAADRGEDHPVRGHPRHLRDGHGLRDGASRNTTRRSGSSASSPTWGTRSRASRT